LAVVAYRRCGHRDSECPKKSAAMRRN
jgi:hypothetical protein